MISIKKISIHELPALIRISYEGDEIGLKRFHVERFTLEQAVYCTFKTIKQENTCGQLEYYKIIFNKRPIGYFVARKGVLYSFAIALQFRVKEIVLPWWNLLKRITGQVFETAIYANNTRAINFLKKRGMRVISVDQQTKIVKLINL